MTITIKADIRQYIAQNIGLITIAASAVAITLTVDYRPVAFSSLLLLIGSLSILCLNWMMLYSYKWNIREETITRTHGILTKHTDHLELYRVVDYRETQTFFQQLLGVKTVTLISTDKSDPVMPIHGIRRQIDLVTIIRNKVELSKQHKHIYEIANL